MSYGLVSQARRMVRKAVNPYDRATIVSIFPIELNETKPTLFPGKFSVPAGSEDKPSIVVVEPSSWFREIDENMPAIEVQVNSYTVAKSIVDDYCVGFPRCTMGVAQPGLFYVPGKYDADSIQKYMSEDKPPLTYQKLLQKYIMLQRNWYSELVKMADVDWARTNGNPTSISQLSKIAAKALGLTSKPWVSDFLAVANSPCPACGVMVNPAFPKCASCGFIIDKVKAIEIGLIEKLDQPSQVDTSFLNK